MRETEKQKRMNIYYYHLHVRIKYTHIHIYTHRVNFNFLNVDPEKYSSWKRSLKNVLRYIIKYVSVIFIRFNLTALL